jgi:hypothetical protein
MRRRSINGPRALLCAALMAFLTGILFGHVGGSPRRIALA